MQNRTMMNGQLQGKVYTASIECLKDPALFDAWLKRVPEARRAKAEKLRNPDVRRQSLGAGALLSYALLDYTEHMLKTTDSCLAGAEEGRIRHSEAAGQEAPGVCRLCAGDLPYLRIEEEPEGRPYLPDFPEIHFSLSHSGDRVMCAVGPSEIGCDVEEVLGKAPEKGKHLIRMVSRCFTPSEQRMVAEDPENFSRIWTLKESFLKLTGKGILLPLSSFEISLDPLSLRIMHEKEGHAADADTEKLESVLDDIRLAQVCMKEYGWIDGYRYACMAQGCTLPEEMISVDLREAAKDISEQSDINCLRLTTYTSW